MTAHSRDAGDFGFGPGGAVAEGATSPSGGTGARLWSTTTRCWLGWDGTKWTAAAANDVKGSALTAQTAGSSGLAAADLWLTGDVSDTTQGAGGTWKKITELVAAQGRHYLYSNWSTAQVLNAGGTSDAMLAGSNIVLPGVPIAGTRYRCVWDISKTAAGTATPIVTVRVGTSGTGAVTDTARLVFTFGAGTAVAEVGEFAVDCHFRNIGGSAVLVGVCTIKGHLSTTGLSNAKRALAVVSSTFDSTTATVISTSYNGGSGAVHTSESCQSDLIP